MEKLPSGHLTRANGETANYLKHVWDVWFGIDKEISGNEDNPLVRATAGGRWQLRLRTVRYIDSDYGKVAGFELEDVWTIIESDRLPTIGMRVRSNAAPEFD
jgi:hypothetical protein